MPHGTLSNMTPTQDRSIWWLALSLLSLASACAPLDRSKHLHRLKTKLAEECLQSGSPKQPSGFNGLQHGRAQMWKKAFLDIVSVIVEYEKVQLVVNSESHRIQAAEALIEAQPRQN